MPRSLPTLAALSLCVAATLQAAEPVSRVQVLDAIHTFETYASGGGAAPSAVAFDKNDAVVRASNTIFRFAVDSDDVVVDLGPDSVTWCDVKKGLSDLPNSGARGLLLAAYLAGSVKSQLQSGKHDPNPYPGWLAMLRVYRAVRMREGVTIPEVEPLLARQAAGTLEAYAADAVRRSAEALRRTYGSPAKQAGPP
jgi:hypothetical protein